MGTEVSVVAVLVGPVVFVVPIVLVAVVDQVVVAGPFVVPVTGAVVVIVAAVVGGMRRPGIGSRAGQEQRTWSWTGNCVL
jgi:hypothetical protein